MGEESSLAVKEFAETASTDILDKQKAQLAADSHLEHAKIDDFVVLDVFSSPPIESGVGTSKGTLFVDGNHTRVSNVYINSHYKLSQKYICIKNNITFNLTYVLIIS